MHLLKIPIFLKIFNSLPYIAIKKRQKKKPMYVSGEGQGDEEKWEEKKLHYLEMGLQVKKKGGTLAEKLAKNPI